MWPETDGAFLSCEFSLPGMQAAKRSYLKSASREETLIKKREGKKTAFLFIYINHLPIQIHLCFLTAPVGDGDDEKRSSKQGEVRGQG